MKALIILSGGQDSVTCLYWAMKQKRFDSIEAVTFWYGQNHQVELGKAQYICNLENIPHKTIHLSFMPGVSSSALVHGGNVSAELPTGLPASFVPNRNAIFITLAHTYAQKIGAEVLIGGMCETDYSGYPDCREGFIDDLIKVLNLGSGAAILMLTPLMHLTKAQTFKLAYDIGKVREVIEYSHTCYNGDHRTKHEWGYGCGECPACKLRQKGYIEFVDIMNKLHNVANPT